MTRSAGLALILALCACGAAPAPRTPRLDPEALFAQVAPSVVYTRARYEAGPDDVTVDTGVGVLIHASGLVLTSCHQLTHSDDGVKAKEIELLLAEPDPVRHTFRPSAPIKADVVACSDEPDLGLVRMRGGGHGRAPIALATALPRPGGWFAVVGATHLVFLWSVQQCLALGIGD